MKVRLIYPKSQATNDAVFASSRLVNEFLRLATKVTGDEVYDPGKRAFHVPPLNLMLLAAFLPKDIEVSIEDERIGPINFDADVDLVGITSLTADATRAYEICDEYRRRGVKVVLGGMHPTVMPAEALSHANAVAQGECDDLFVEIVRDARAGKLRTHYMRSALHDLRELPHPRKDLLDERYYITQNVIQATRGCPHRCSFCSISAISGPTYRCRPVLEILEEVSRSPKGFHVFVDDNFGGNIPYTRALLSALAPMGIHWYGSITTAALHDARLLDALSRSGCKMVLIGFESLSQVTLKQIDKSFNQVEQYFDLVRRLHSLGVGVIGSFMLGLDDAPDDINRIVEFALSAPLDIAQISILTPYPGTRLYDEMRKAKRILTTDWRYYDTTAANVVFSPKHTSPAELENDYLAAFERIYSALGIATRLVRSHTYPTFFLPYNIRQRKKSAAARAIIETRRRSVVERQVTAEAQKTTDDTLTIIQ